MSGPTEAECQRTIIEAAKRGGWLCHAERPAQFKDGRWSTPIQGDRGFVDLVCVRRGQLVCIELKKDKTGRMGPGQQEWIDQLDAVPGVTALFVWVPSQMDALVARLVQR